MSTPSHPSTPPPPTNELPGRSPAGPPWLGLALGALTTLFLLVGISALGIVGGGGTSDLAYLAAPAVAVIGVLVARLRPRGSAIALGAAAAVVVAVAVGVLASGLPADASALDVLGISAMYAGLFAVAGWLCLRAERA